jgi:hypothetical protein
LVQQYNGYVMSWNDGIQTSFDGFTFKAQLGNYAQAPLQKMSIIDPTPNEKNVLTYIPLQYQTATNIPILTGEFKFNDASSIVTSLAIVYSWDVQKIQVNVPLFGIRKDVITGLSPQRRKKKFEVFNFLECDDSNGHFLPATSECQTYWVLSGICVLFDSRTKKIAQVGTDFGCTPGQNGPYPNQWRAGIYTKVDRAPVSQARLGPLNTQPQTSGSYMLREVHDPFVRYNEMTAGNLNFRDIRTQPYLGLGIAFLVMAIVPFMFAFVLGMWGCVTLIKLLPGLLNKGPTDAQHGLLNEDEYMEEPEGREDRQFPLEYGNQ